MDLHSFKLDIDELINEFAETGSTTMAEFKKVWLSRKFSFVFEASPSTNQGCFMQTLYAHGIGYLVSTDSLSKRLGGLYCLYCLYETQPFKPPFKIYLSLGEFKRLKNIVADANATGAKVVSAVVKRMLGRNMFLLGFVGVNEGSAAERVNELTEIQNACVKAAYKKLSENTRLEHFIHLDVGLELDVEFLKKRSSEYAMAKELAIREASEVIDVENVRHIAENERLIGDVVEKTATDWKLQKEMFYERTGFGQSVAVKPPDQEENFQDDTYSENLNQEELSQNLQIQEGVENFQHQEDQDNFSKELEEELLFQLGD